MSDIGEVAKAVAKLISSNTSESTKYADELLSIMQQLVNIKSNATQAKINSMTRQEKYDSNHEEGDGEDDAIYYVFGLQKNPGWSFTQIKKKFNGSKDDFIDFLRRQVNDFFKENGR